MIPEAKHAARWMARLLPRKVRVSDFTYHQDGLATVHNVDFIKDARFAHAYAKGRATGSWGQADPAWRAHVCCWAAEKGRTLEGDFVECGVNRGGLAMTVLTYVDLDALPKRFFLLDTFSGLVEKYITPQERTLGKKAGGYEECYEAVRRTFAEHPNVVLVRGSVPDTLPQVTAKRVSFLSIDMNCVAPELAAIEFFWDKLVSGAVVVLDDYGWAGHSEQKLGFDAFARRQGIEILSLPTGQGLFIKP
jgi:hypothetical protein